MVFSLVYMVVRWLTGLVVVLSRGDLSKEVELLVLRHENAVLRRQVPRPRYEPADRIWLAALSRLVPRRRWSVVFPVTRATILRWHQRLVARKWTYTDRDWPVRCENSCRHLTWPSTAAAMACALAERSAWLVRSRHACRSRSRYVVANALVEPSASTRTSRDLHG
jgi:hypothetical protein